jgi:hypothetical protein
MRPINCGGNMLANDWLDRSRKIVVHPKLQYAHDPALWVEVFVTANLAILAADIVIAHSVNHFGKPAEYIPLYVSLVAPIVLVVLITLRWLGGFHSAWRDMGYLVGWLSILVGLGGVLYHLESRFFLDTTLKSLTYAAPFAAPLAYTGLGFLLLVNRILWQLRSFADRSRIKWLFCPNGVDPSNLVCFCNRLPNCSAHYARNEALSRPLFNRDDRTSARGRPRLLVPHAGKPG